jgi:pimeloyl-ACP methyl ester carboxylesterase
MRKMGRLVSLLVVSMALVVGAICLLGLTQAPDATLPAGARGTHVDVGGVPIRYAQAGRGADILLIHGSPGSVEDWDAVFDRLAQRFRVTAFDRHGHGYSGGARRPHTPGENARVASGLIRALGLRDVVVVGHSYGGATALAMATTPETPDVRALVLVGARAYGPVNVDGIFRLLALPAFGPGFGRLMGPFIGPSRVEAGIRASFGPNVGAMPAGFAAPRARLWTRPTVSATLAEERTTFEESLDAQSARYPEIRRPVWIVCGDQDEPNTSQARRLAGEIPGARLVILPDTGHYVQFARPDAVIAAIEAAAAP